MFNRNTWYRHYRKLCSIRLLLCCPFFLTWSCLFFPSAYATFLFNCSCHRSLFDAHFKPSRPAFQLAPVCKRGLILSTPAVSAHLHPSLFSQSMLAAAMWDVTSTSQSIYRSISSNSSWGYGVPSLFLTIHPYNLLLLGGSLGCILCPRRVGVM